MSAKESTVAVTDRFAAVHARAVAAFEASPDLKGQWIDADAFARAVVRGTRETLEATNAAAAEKEVGPTIEAIRAQAKADWAANVENCRRDFLDEDLYIRAMVRESGQSH